ncbi:MAG TPA: FkbM family methyltransferase [Candidatus Acidoferrales bacterium]|nr:FkbM family methyltransferase [Candidatus Acidoferrales bacterium]
MTATGNSMTFSQFGEDQLVWKFFGEKVSGFFVDVGANEPDELSQSLLLENKGWNGILVEPQSDCCVRLREKRPRSRVFQVACGAPEQRGKAMLQLSLQESKLATGQGNLPKDGYEEVEVMTLDDILAQSPHPQLDFVSIDVEGLELQVLRGFDILKHRPRLMIIEDNLPNRLKVHAYIKKHGYRLVKRT